MKILFLNMGRHKNFTFSCEPSITILASWINAKSSHHAYIHDLSYSGEKWEYDLVRALKKIDPDIIGYNSETKLGFDYFSFFISKVREKTKVPFIAGGFDITVNQNSYKEIGALDYLLSGDGEGPIITLLDRLEKKASTLGIKGLWVRKEHDKKYMVRGDFFNDFSDCPDLDWELWNTLYQNLYFTGRLSFIRNRGCPERCTFCGNYEMAAAVDGQHLRLYNPEKYAQELVRAWHKYKNRGLSAFKLHDPNITVSYDWCTRFCRELASLSKGGIPFSAYCNIKTLTDDLASKLKKAGCIRLRGGIESGDGYIRRHLYKKDICAKEIRQYMDICRKYDIGVTAYYIMGGPYESFGSMYKSFRMSRLYPCEQSLVAKFTPFTKRSYQIGISKGSGSCRDNEKINTLGGIPYISFFKMPGWHYWTSLKNAVFANFLSGIMFLELLMNILKKMKHNYFIHLGIYLGRGLKYRLSLLQLIFYYHFLYCDNLISSNKRANK